MFPSSVLEEDPLSCTCECLSCSNISDSTNQGVPQDLGWEPMIAYRLSLFIMCRVLAVVKD